MGEREGEEAGPVRLSDAELLRRVRELLAPAAKALDRIGRTYHCEAGLLARKEAERSCFYCAQQVLALLERERPASASAAGKPGSA